MGKGVDLGVFGFIAVNAAETGQCVLPVDVHGARPTDALSARPTERQRWVDFVLDFDESIQYLSLKF